MTEVLERLPEVEVVPSVGRYYTLSTDLRLLVFVMMNTHSLLYRSYSMGIQRDKLSLG